MTSIKKKKKKLMDGRASSLTKKGSGTISIFENGGNGNPKKTWLLDLTMVLYIYI